MARSFGDPMLEHWYKALASPLGIEVQCFPSLTQVRHKLYALRNEVKDEDLDKISLVQSPFDAGRLWLIKRSGDA